MDGFEWMFSPHSLIEFEDGSFLVVGTSGAADIEENMDYSACLYKINSMGIEQWHKEFSYGGDDAGYALCRTNDNGYLITGWADNNRNADYWMIKTDSNGDEIWNKNFGGSKYDFGHSRNCYQTGDGGYIMSGYTYSYGAGKLDAWIVKTDSMGNMDWNRTYGDKQDDVCWSFESTNDDSYVFCMTYNINGNIGDKDDIHLVKTDSDGHIIWIQEFGGEGRQVGQHICKTSDGGFIVSGRTGKYFDFSSDGLLVKFAQYENERPIKPDIDGPSKGKPDEEYTFTAITSDPDGDSLQYMWDWGDGNFSDWLDTNEALVRPI